jgi:peptidoglycan/xylan/chitin deacetylase (PgdA/CDA1 family)
MKFVIRDDDLNYFSTSADIIRCYDGVFSKRIPVSFATIPFVKPTSDVYPRNIPQYDREYPFSSNVDLVEYIGGNSLIEILQHGCTHETKSGVYEYAKHHGLVGTTRRGKNELERALGTNVKVFVPPHDWISSHGVRDVEDAGMHIIRGRGAGLRNWIPRWQYVKTFVAMAYFRFPRYLSRMPPVYPHVLDFGQHQEMCSYRIEDPDVYDGLEYVKRMDGTFVITMHVHDFSEGKKQRLMELVRKAEVCGAQFVRASEIFS